MGFPLEQQEMKDPHDWNSTSLIPVTIMASATASTDPSSGPHRRLCFYRRSRHGRRRGRQRQRRRTADGQV